MRGYIHEDGMESGVHRKMQEGITRWLRSRTPPPGGGGEPRGRVPQSHHNPNRRASRDRPTFSTCPQSVFVSGITRNELAGDVRHSPGGSSRGDAQSVDAPAAGW